MIYIATNVHGRGVQHVTAFNNRLDLLTYADDITAFTDTNIPRAATIDDICDGLYDKGIGFGARSHSRVSRDYARKLIRDGVKETGRYN